MNDAAPALTDSRSAARNRAGSASRRPRSAYPGNLVVRAGAGSGKTEVLARRFVALVAGDLADRAPLSPAALAAITFTEKAALDLRKRIGVVLTERIAAENNAPESTAERRLHLIARAAHAGARPDLDDSRLLRPYPARESYRGRSRSRLRGARRIREWHVLRAGLPGDAGRRDPGG